MALTTSGTSAERAHRAHQQPAGFSRRLRRALFLVHLWLGLSLGLLAAVMGLSGSLLVFSHEIDERLNPQLLRSMPAAAPTSTSFAPLQPIVKEVQQRFPKAKINFIRVPQNIHGIYELRLDGGRRFVYADSYNGAILGSRVARQTLPGFLFELHTEFLLGERGETLAGITGLALLIMGLTGIVLWWPARSSTQSAGARWRGGFTIKRGHPVRLMWDLHRVVGICAVALLCMVAATGAALVFPDSAAALFSRVTGDAARLKKPKVKKVEGARPITLDAAIAAARAALPGATVMRVTPAAKDGPIAVRLRFPTEMHPNGQSNVQVDPYSGQVLQTASALTAGPAVRLMNLRYPLHTGRWAGLLSRILQVLLGLVPATLYISGLYVWWSKKRKQRTAHTSHTATA